MNDTVRPYRWRWQRLAAWVAVAACGLCLACCGASGGGAASEAATTAPGEQGEFTERPSLEQALAGLKIPPEWFGAVEVQALPAMAVQGARRRIRQDLESSDPEDLRRMVKLAYRYAQKGELGSGHEYPMYLYLGGEYAWALTEFRKTVTPEPLPTAPEHNQLATRYRFLASCYRHFRAYDEAEQALLRALARLPDTNYRTFGEAQVNFALGGLYAEMGEPGKAKSYCEKAVARYRSIQDGGRLAGIFLTNAETRLKLLDAPAIAEAALTDGLYAGKAPGFEGDVGVRVEVSGGRVKQVEVQHQESRQWGSVIIVPARIVAEQSLHVDGVTGATITSEAIVGATFEALKKAGLE